MHPQKHIYPLSATDKNAMVAILRRHLIKDIFHHSTLAPIGFFFIDKKKWVGLRPCIELRGLSQITVKHWNPLLMVPLMLEKLRNAYVSTELNLQSAYGFIIIINGEERKKDFNTYGPVFQCFINVRDCLHWQHSNVFPVHGQSCWKYQASSVPPFPRLPVWQGREVQISWVKVVANGIKSRNFIPL